MEATADELETKDGLLSGCGSGGDPSTSIVGRTQQFYSVLTSSLEVMIGVVGIRGVMIPTPESESESEFPHFSESIDSVFNSNSGKNRFLYCTGIDSGYWNRFRVLESIKKSEMYNFDSDSSKKRNHNTSSLHAICTT